MRAGRITIGEVADFAANLPPTEESALYRALNPDRENYATPILKMLRDIEHAARIGNWYRTVDAQKGVNFPEPRFQTQAEIDEQKAHRLSQEPLLAGLPEVVGIPIADARGLLRM